MSLSQRLWPGSHALQSPPVSSQVRVPHGIWLANALPSALHLVSAFALQATLLGAQTPVVQVPATLLHSDSVAHISCRVKPCPSGVQISSRAPVQRNSVFGTQTAHLPDVMPCRQRRNEEHFCSFLTVPSALHTIKLP